MSLFEIMTSISSSQSAGTSTRSGWAGVTTPPMV
jgi:hypothetical protein